MPDSAESAQVRTQSSEDPSEDPWARGPQVLCVNPAALLGSRGALHPYFTVNANSGLYGGVGTLAGVRTPWVTFPGLYRASCRRAGGASWLQIDDVGPPHDARPRLQALSPHSGFISKT